MGNENKAEDRSSSESNRTRSLCSILCFLFLAAFVPALLSIAVLAFRVDPFDPAPFPAHELTHHSNQRVAPLVNGRMLQGSNFVGSCRLLGPEDLAYDPESRVIYTGCADGWVKRVKLGESVVEDWVNTGGRPLGISIASGGAHLIVADAHKGLLKITKDKEMKVLTTEAEGLKFKLTDGVDVAKDGTIYFTDASSKYGFEEYLFDFLESRPYGRLLSFNPATGETKVLLRDLYFSNGVAVSPDQNSLVFCETPLKRCRRFWLRGSKQGVVDAFVDNLPGYPDNIHSDEQSTYWIAISSRPSPYLEQALRYRPVRKGIVILERYISLVHHVQRNGGILGVDLQGNPTAHFYDPAMSLISSGIKIDNHLYVGSLQYPHIISFNLSNS